MRFLVYCCRVFRKGRITFFVIRYFVKMVNPNLKNLGLLPIASAAAACADLNARLPLPINRDQTRLYRAAFDKLGANGTVALRSLSNLIDSDSGKTLSYNELKDPKQYIGMTSIANEKTEWNYQSKSEKVYVVCKKISCQEIPLSGDKKYPQRLINHYKSQIKLQINNADHNAHHHF